MAEKKHIGIDLADKISKENKLIEHVFLIQTDAKQGKLGQYAKP